MELAPGRVVEDRYEVLSLIRKGGMGAVYKVQDVRLAASTCALKLMHSADDMPGDPFDIEYRFNQEMRVLTSLRHEGIPRVLDFFKCGDSLAIIMDFIEGENLEQIVNRGPLPEEAILNVAEQILDILIFLHGHAPPVVHRDVKPANIILNASTQRYMLVDFGLARTIGGNMTHTVAGTLGYAPVEQLQGLSEIRSDIYAVGATMHHLLTGVVPRAFTPLPVRGARPTVSKAVEELVERASQMVAEDRFPDALSMRIAVQEARARLGAGEETGTNEPAAPPTSSAVERILIVDDDTLVLDVLRRVLERELYQVTTAGNGQQALEAALRQPPDLIISDLDMPGFSGVALCQKLRSYRLTRDIPVLLLTGSTDVEDERRGLEEGAEDYISKPIVPVRLVARVQAALRRRFTRRP